MVTSLDLDYDVINYCGKTYFLDFNSGVLLHLYPELREVLYYIRENPDRLMIEDLKRVFKGRRYRDTILDLTNILDAGFLMKKEVCMDDFNTVRMHITHECNMECKHCSQGDLRGGMNTQTAKNTVDFLLDASPHNDLKLVFLGGEPLIEFQLIEIIVDYAGEAQQKRPDKNIAFSLTTNGTLLDDAVVDYLYRHGVAVMVRFDGKVGSFFRRSYDRRSVYPLVVDNIKKLCEKLSPSGFAVSITIHRYNKELPDILSFLIDLGVREIKITFDKSDDSSFRLLREDYDDLIERTDEIFSIAYDNPGVNIEYFSPGLRPGGAFQYAYNCGACHRELTVDIDGNLFPCSFFIDKKVFCLGNLNVDNDFNGKLYNKIKASLNRSSNRCTDCSSRRICGGHCPYEGYKLYGRFEEPNVNRCRLYKKISGEKIRRYLEEMSR